MLPESGIPEEIGRLGVEEDPMVFLVDDEETVVSVLRRILEHGGYRVRGFHDPYVAETAIEGEPPALLITDRQMPGMDGITLARKAIEVDGDIAVMVLTGAGDVESAAESLRLGLIDYLTKPIEPDALTSAVRRALNTRAQNIFRREAYGWLKEEVARRMQEVREKHEQLERTNVGVLGTLTRILDAKSPFFRGHSEHVARVSAEIARQLELGDEEVELARQAGLLHDIGMIGVSDQIVDKPTSLTADEYATVKAHCRVGADILTPLPHLEPIAEYILHHHERLDGTGYPDGLMGPAIPLGAQIVGLAEAWSALTEDRPHRPALSEAEAIATLRGAEGAWFRPDLITALERAVGD